MMREKSNQSFYKCFNKNKRGYPVTLYFMSAFRVCNYIFMSALFSLCLQIIARVCIFRVCNFKKCRHIADIEHFLQKNKGFREIPKTLKNC